jgi:hypothetical protein
VQLDIVALSLAISMHGVMAILDFWITDPKAMYDFDGMHGGSWL